MYLLNKKIDNFPIFSNFPLHKINENFPQEHPSQFLEKSVQKLCEIIFHNFRKIAGNISQPISSSHETIKTLTITRST